MAPLKTRTTTCSTPSHKRTTRPYGANGEPTPTTIVPPSIKKLRASRDDNDSSSSTVGVYLRLRPLKIDEPTMVKLDEQQVKATPPEGNSERIYSFTHVFDNATQSEIFNQVAKPLVDDLILKGQDGLVFTYGITGSGKTHTMSGSPSDPGLICRTIDFLFNSIGSHQTKEGLVECGGKNDYTINLDHETLYPQLRQQHETLPSVIKWRNRQREKGHVELTQSHQYCVFMSVVELYNNRVYDLLDDEGFTNNEREKKREIRTDERGFSYVANAVEKEVKSADDAVDLYTRGVRRRKTGSTALNQESSRGHCVLTLKLIQLHEVRSRHDRCSINRISQLCLVDLAGSERAKRSGATGGTLHEASNINNSLGALRKCIRTLSEGRSTAHIQYREYNLTRLFRSYFEGHGSVRMVLCVKPTPEDCKENINAMEFGVLTQDVPIDYAPPPKMPKRYESHSNGHSVVQFLDRRRSRHEPDPSIEDKQFFQDWKEFLKSSRNNRDEHRETLAELQAEFRNHLCQTEEQNIKLSEENKTRVKELCSRKEQVKSLETKLTDVLSNQDSHTKNLVRKLQSLEKENSEKDKQLQKFSAVERLHQSRERKYERLCRNMLNLIKTEKDRQEGRKRVEHLLKELEMDEWTDTHAVGTNTTSATPSAPRMEPMQSSSPITSTTETTESHQTTPPTTTNSSSEVLENLVREQVRASRSPVKAYVVSPKNGVPVVNPRHNRSLSCPGGRWVFHKPPGTIDTGTVLKAEIKNGKFVRKLRSSDIRRKNAAGYSVVNQVADDYGDVETMIYKGQIKPTRCGGVQVEFNDIETMKQLSPERRRPTSDVHMTH